MPATADAGRGYASPAEVTKTPGCPTKRTDCGGRTTPGTWPGPRGPMTRSVNRDRFGGRECQRTFDGHFG